MGAAARPVLVGCGLAFGALALTFSVWQAAGGHGSYLPAKLLFPFSMLTTILDQHLNVTGAVLAVAQWPIYGAILGSVSARNRQNAAFALAVVHAVAVVACFMFVSPEIFP